MDQKSTKQVLEFLHQIEQLKKTIRFDSVRNALNESVADHSWRLAMMTFLIAEELNLKIDKCKAVKLSLIHDLGAYAQGDVDHRKIVSGEILKNEQQKAEKMGIDKLKKLLPVSLGRDLISLWDELESGLSQEAKFVRALEKLETLSHIYEAGYQTYDQLEQIPNYANKAVKNFPILTEMLREIKKQLKLEFEKGGFVWKKEYNRFD